MVQSGVQSLLATPRALSTVFKDLDSTNLLQRLLPDSSGQQLADDTLDALLGLARWLLRVEVLQDEARQAAGEAIIQILKDSWGARERLVDIKIQCYRTMFANPLIYGQSLVKGFVDFYLSDLIATLHLLYDTVVFTAKIQGCLQLEAWTTLGAYVLDADQAALVTASIAASAEPCDDLLEVVRVLDEVREWLEQFLVSDGLTKLIESAPDMIIDMLDTLVVLLRVLPPFLSGPGLDYAASVAKDPEALGRINGTVLALIVGLISGIEEFLVLATGVKLVKPVVIAGGILGPILEPDEQPRSRLGPAAERANPVIRGLLKASRELSAAERQLVIRLWRLFLQFSEARALERAGLMAAEFEEITKTFPELRPLFLSRKGTRRIRLEDMKAAGDLARKSQQLAIASRRLKPVMKRLAARVHYQQESYGGLARLRNQVNAQIERFFIFTEASRTAPRVRVDLELKSAELQQKLFEVAHILDKRFGVPTTPQRATWRSFREFADTMTEWKTGNVIDETKMPAIMLFGSEHRIPDNPLRELGVTYESPQTVTAAMERWIVFADGVPAEKLAAAQAAGKFIVDANTAARDVVLAQRAVYQRYFPDIFGKIQDRLDDIANRLPPSGRPPWMPK